MRGLSHQLTGSDTDKSNIKKLRWTPKNPNN